MIQLQPPYNSTKNITEPLVQSTYKSFDMNSKKENKCTPWKNILFCWTCWWGPTQRIEVYLAHLCHNTNGIIINTTKGVYKTVINIILLTSSFLLPSFLLSINPYFFRPPYSYGNFDVEIKHRREQTGR